MRFQSYTTLLLLLTVVVAAWMMPAATAQGDPNPPSISSNRGAWPLLRQWNMEEVRHYARWIEHIYYMKTDGGDVDQRQARLDRIITDPEMNLLEDPNFLGRGNAQLPRSTLMFCHNHVDCAKLGVFLPAYYAYRRGLPWMMSYVSSGGQGDVRTSPNNIPGGQLSSFTAGSVNNFFRNMTVGFSTGNFRVELNGRNAHLSDTLPVAIDPDYLLPGAINYLDGHTLILGTVSPYGELQFLNASITPTRDIYTYNGMNTVSGITPRGSQSDENEWAGCFHGMRIWRFPIAETNSQGVVTNVRRRTNEEMREFGFSTEQYTVLESLIEQRFIDMGDFRPTDYHAFVRLRMKSVDYIRPLEFMEQYVEEILDAYIFREDFVQAAWTNVQQNGPITFPAERPDENIFQAHGRWETWSSPSSDVDRRNKYHYLADWVRYAIDCFGMMPDFVDLTGLEAYEIRTQADLARALIAEKERIFDEHYMHYTNSRGERVRLTLTDIEDRLYDMSFDPNHPPELRWGAPWDSPEMEGAPERSTPVPSGSPVPMREAYELQTFYRSVGQRQIEMSILRGMFTEGFPVLYRFNEQIARCFYMDEPTEALSEWLAKNYPDEFGEEEEEEEPVIVPPLLPISMSVQ